MASSVFFRFKSQREPTRVAFDGTGVSVFELKREIISLSRLGDGTDFELVITSEDASEEYDDDTSIIPRSTTVIAKRLPAAKPGRGGAARYVSGKMPQNAKNSSRQETSQTSQNSNKPQASSAPINNAQTEEERMAAIMQMGADEWAQDQQAMANATPVLRGGPVKGKLGSQPDHPPPAGYICYRCGEKGHWIQACPTNNDPTFDGRPRVKRTTGIPRSFLKTVEKPTAQANDGLVDDTKQPSGVMVNAEGEWVVAEPDKAAWDRFQAKAQVSAAAEKAENQGSKELQERGLECSIDKHLFVNPTKTPCCKKTFCHECITNALLENDLTCPECSTEDVPIDNLTPDTETAKKVQSYEAEEASRHSPQAKSEEGSPKAVKSDNRLSEDGLKVPNDSVLRKTPSPTPDKSPRKRPAETELANDRKAPGPTGTSAEDSRNSKSKTETAPTATSDKTTQQSSFPNAGMMPMGFPDMNGMNLMNGMNGMMPNMGAMGMNFGMANPMMMAGGPFMNNDFNNMWGGGFNPQAMGMGMPGGMMGGNGFGGQGMYNQMGNGGMQNNNMGQIHQNPGFFANQQRTSFGNQSANDDDSPYFRKPVNPHRHQPRRNLNRPADYREI